MTYLFVATPTRVGAINLIGPETGTTYTIRPTGSWINEIDKELLNEEIPYYCWKRGGFVTTKINEIVPDFRQLTTMPKSD